MALDTLDPGTLEVTATWLKPRVGSLSLGPGGCELEVLGDGRWAQRGSEQHASVALDRRRLGTLESSELQFAWRRGCYNNRWTEDVNETFRVQRVWVASRVRYRLGLRKSYFQRTTTTGLISCRGGEHWLVSLRARSERQRRRTEMKSLQPSSPKRVLM